MKLLVLPVVLGLIAVLLVNTYISSRETPEIETVQVVVAATSIPAKTTLSADMLVSKPMPRDFATSGTITDLADVVGKVTVAPLVPGEILLQAKLMKDDTPTALSFHVPSKMRGITVGVNEVSGVSGHIQPGDRVDVIATFTESVAGLHRSRLILEAVPVLAVGKSLEAGKESGGDSSTLTLSVTPDESILLTLADEMGKLRFTLRPSLPEPAVGETEYTIRRFHEPPPEGVPLRLKAQARVKFSLWEVDSGTIGAFMEDRGELCFSLLDRNALDIEGLEDAGFARRVAQSETLVLDGDVAAFALEGTVASKEASQDLVSWHGYGLKVQALPVTYKGPFFDVDLLAEVREIPEAGNSHPSQAIKRCTQGTVRLDTSQVIGLGGIYRRAGKSHVLPAEYVSIEVRQGSRDLLLLIEPSID